MKKFNVIISKDYEFEIEIDDEALNARTDNGDFIGTHKQYFFDYDNWKEHAEHIGAALADGQTFIEGYGIPYENGKPQVFHKDDSEPAINFKLIKAEVFTDSADLDE